MTRPLSRMRSTTSASPVGLGARWTPPPPRVASAVVAMFSPPYFLLEVALEREREPLLFRRPLPDVDLAFEEPERLRDDDDEALLAFVERDRVRPPLDFCFAVARWLCSSSSSSSCSARSSASASS